MVKPGERYICMPPPSKLLIASAVVLIANGQIWSHGPQTAECGSLNGHPPGVRGHQSSVYASNAIDSSGVSNPQSQNMTHNGGA